MKTADRGWIFHALAPLPTLAFLAFGIAREAHQNGGLAGMGLHAWGEALAWSVLPFFGTISVVILVDVLRARRKKSSNAS
jgi:hypothetical protein